jgi:hypothetical protein
LEINGKYERIIPAWVAIVPGFSIHANISFTAKLSGKVPVFEYRNGKKHKEQFYLPSYLILPHVLA